jgi:hypothetical protein
MYKDLKNPYHVVGFEPTDFSSEDGHEDHYFLIWIILQWNIVEKTISFKSNTLGRSKTNKLTAKKIPANAAAYCHRILFLFPQDAIV